MEVLDKLRDRIQNIEVAMFTTLDQGTLRSRPMAVRHVERDTDLWFFSDKDSAKIHELAIDCHANASFSDPKHNTYVSVSGSVEYIQDLEKQREFWTPLAKLWFSGPDDPNLVLLKLNMESAEYWDSSSNRMVNLFNLVKAMAGQPSDLGEHERITVVGNQSIIT